MKRPLDILAASMASNFLKAHGSLDAAIDKLQTASKDTSSEGRALYRRAIQLLRTDSKPRRFPRKRT